MSQINTLTLTIPENNYRPLAMLRWSLAVVFLWIGAMKFTEYEATGIEPLIKNSPLMSWMLTLGGKLGASKFIGVIELLTASALIAGAKNAKLSALGSAMSISTFVGTLTFMLSTPGVAEASAGGFPALSAMPGQFLLKDIVLLAASLVLLLSGVNQRNTHGFNSFEPRKI